MKTWIYAYIKEEITHQKILRLSPQMQPSQFNDCFVKVSFNLLLKYQIRD